MLIKRKGTEKCYVFRNRDVEAWTFVNFKSLVTSRVLKLNQELSCKLNCSRTFERTLHSRSPSYIVAVFTASEKGIEKCYEFKNRDVKAWKFINFKSLVKSRILKLNQKLSSKLSCSRVFERTLHRRSTSPCRCGVQGEEVGYGTCLLEFKREIKCKTFTLQFSSTLFFLFNLPLDSVTLGEANLTQRRSSDRSLQNASESTSFSICFCPLKVCFKSANRS